MTDTQRAKLIEKAKAYLIEVDGIQINLGEVIEAQDRKIIELGDMIHKRGNTIAELRQALKKAGTA